MLKKLLLPLALCAASTAHAAPGIDDDLDALLQLSLEELGNVPVTATSRRATPLTDTPASVFVIDGDDLRVLGIRTLPEALRLAPNLQVARINASSYAVSARGMKTSLSNKLLVMVDGRPIYTPLFAGVLWDMQSVPIEEIERIEVVSGPGAAAWGANAVNGVINIVTRRAQDLTGGYVKAWAGEGGSAVTAGQAFDAGVDGAVRMYAQHERVERSDTAQGREIPDGWMQRQVGFRGDWQRGDDGFRLQGDAYDAESSARPAGPVEATGYNLLARWDHVESADNQWSLQAYYDVVDRLDPLVIDDRMSIAAVEFVQDTLVGTHRLTWGVGYRQGLDESRPGLLARLVPDERTLEWGHAFIQDQVAVTARLTVDLGLRLDSNPYTGVEALPTARFALRQHNGGLLWGAVSRAVRAPARFDRDFFFPASEPFIIRGGPDFESEVSNVAELGYRIQPTEWLSLSVTGFHHWYDELRAGTLAPGGGVFVANGVEGRAYGVEGWATLRMPERWELAFGFLELRQRLELKPGFRDPAAVRDQGNDPEHQFQLRATRRIGERQQISAFARRVGALPAPYIPAYTQVDVRWSYMPTRTIEFGVAVRNLFDERHTELQPVNGLPASEFGRTLQADLRVGW